MTPLNTYDLLTLSSALIAVFMLGSVHVRTNLICYAVHTLLLAGLTLWLGIVTGERHLLYSAIVVGAFKAIFTPLFLSWVTKKVGVMRDQGTFLPCSISMGLGTALLGVSYLLVEQLPTVLGEGQPRIGATSAFSMLFTGMLLMLTRRTAISQIIGFLVLENGIYMFTISQTNGMPMMVEMGILLDVFVAVMVTGLILFKIKKNFEHIDVTLLSDLKD